MQTIASYGLLGSLAAGALGVVILALVTFRYGLRRRRTVDDADETSSRLARSIRWADTAAVLCFAVSAALAVLTLTQQTRTPAGSRGDGPLTARLQELEERLAVAEAQLDAGAATVVQPTPWEPRIERLEQRLGSVEDRAATAQRMATATPVPERTQVSRGTNGGGTAAPGARTATAPPPRAAREKNRDADQTRTTPVAASTEPAPPTVPIDAPATPAADPAPPVASPPAVATVASTPSPPSTPPDAAEPTLGETVASGWDSLKRDVGRAGKEWAEGWRRLFGK